jgi:hypothetical protein
MSPEVSRIMNRDEYVLVDGKWVYSSTKAETFLSTAEMMQQSPEQSHQSKNEVFDM